MLVHVGKYTHVDSLRNTQAKSDQDLLALILITFFTKDFKLILSQNA